MSRIGIFVGSFICIATQLLAQDATLINAVDTALSGSQPGRVNVSGDVYYLRPAIVVNDGASTLVAGTISHRRRSQNYAQLYYLFHKKMNGTVESKIAFVEGATLILAVFGMMSRSPTKLCSVMARQCRHSIGKGRIQHGWRMLRRFPKCTLIVSNLDT